MAILIAVGIANVALHAVGRSGDADFSSDLDLAATERPRDSKPFTNTPEGRIRFAAELDTIYLARGYDATVRAEGPNHTTLLLEYPLADRTWAYQVQKDVDLRLKLAKWGFRRLEIGDGYRHAWRWDLP